MFDVLEFKISSDDYRSLRRRKFNLSLKPQAQINGVVFHVTMSNLVAVRACCEVLAAYRQRFECDRSFNRRFQRAETPTVFHFRNFNGLQRAEKTPGFNQEVNSGLAHPKTLFVEYDAEEQFEEDELVQRLTEFREGLREKYEVGMTLNEQLQSAVLNEDYELAASLRDQLSKRNNR